MNNPINFMSSSHMEISVKMYSTDSNRIHNNISKFIEINLGQMKYSFYMEELFRTLSFIFLMLDSMGNKFDNSFDAVQSFITKSIQDTYNL